jgi:hypothetical protein
MFKITRATPLHRFLEFCFNVYAQFHGKDFSWHRDKGLEKSDFCRITRFSVIYMPLIIAAEILGTIGLFYIMVLHPLMNSVNPVSAMVPLVVVTVCFVVAIIAIIAIIFYLSERGDKRRKQREDEYETAYRLWRQGLGPNPDEKPIKPPTGFKAFWILVHDSIKERFCPIVKFEE